jgi:glycosyltransferase involved in cell wall biosynthesis
MTSQRNIGRKHILIVGHPCSPVRGSEPGFTWNWAWHLSEFFDIHVLCHPVFRDEVETYLAQWPNSRLSFTWVTVPKAVDPWRDFTGSRGLKLHYALYQNRVLSVARRLVRAGRIDLIHHVSWGTVSYPPALWKLGVPFIWGPIGGGQTAPAGLREFLGSGWPSERMRNFRVGLLRFLPRVRRAAKGASVALATNGETLNLLRAAGASNASAFLDSGLPTEFVPDRPRTLHRDPGPLRLLWVGKLEWRKALALALRVVTKLPQTVPVELHVVGDGPELNALTGLVEVYGLRQSVIFHGKVHHSEMPGIYAAADVFLFTSLRDSFGTQVLEAMASCLPVIALDHQGVATFMPASAGIKIPIAGAKQVVDGFVDAISTFASSPEARHAAGMAGWEFARTQTWKQRAAEMKTIYDKALNV